MEALGYLHHLEYFQLPLDKFHVGTGSQLQSMAVSLRQFVGLGLILHLLTQGCVDYAIQCSVMVYVFSAAPQFAVGNLKLLQLLLSTMVCIYGYDR